eukprot:PhF_6_TR11518/c0_g1_i1/m.18435
MKRFAAIVLLLLIVASIVNSDTSHSSPTVVVSTTYGPIIGTTNIHPYVGVTKFLGIPFAQPPVGSGRFADPTPPTPWTTPKDCTSFAPACPQSSSATPNRIGYYPPAGKSEDCLYLNVYVPPNTTTSAAKAVMVFVHGGTYVTGSAMFPFYDGALFVTNTDVILVTINYRLGALGGLYTGTSNIHGNYQTKDQRLAFQWVQDNIYSFGGDPSRVTIFGESAGAYSVVVHYVSPPSYGLFQNMISESPPMISAAQSPQSALLLANAVLRCLGCPNTTNPSHVSCLMAADANAIVNCQHPTNNIGLTMSQNVMQWLPVIDGYDLTQQPTKSIREGAVSPNTTLVLGTNHDEFYLFYQANYPNPIPYANLTSMWNTLYHHNPNVTATLTAMYNVDPASRDIRPTLAKYLTDLMFACSTRYIAEAAPSSGGSTYMYRHSYNYSLNEWLFGAETPLCVNRTCHFQELYLLFNNTYLYDGKKSVPHSNDVDDRLIAAMQTYWSNVAKTGNPNFGSVRQVLPVAWPVYTSDRKEILHLTSTPHVSTNMMDQSICDYLDQFGYPL